MNNMKEKDPDMWRYKVRCSRIVDFRIPGGGQVGVNSIVERKQVVCTFTGFLRQVAAPELRAPDSWLLKTEFVRWMQDHRDYSKEDAVREWDRRKDDPRVFKWTTPDGPRMAVAEPPQTVGSVRRELGVDVQRTGQLATAGQLGEALSGLAGIGSGQFGLGGSAFAGFGQSTGSGQAAGRVGPMDPAGSAEMPVPAASAVVDEGFFTAPAPAARPQLARHASDGGESKQVRKGPAAGTMGDLADLRNEAGQILDGIHKCIRLVNVGEVKLSLGPNILSGEITVGIRELMPKMRHGPVGILGAVVIKAAWVPWGV